MASQQTINRVNVRAILKDQGLRRKLMVWAIQATQAREGIETTPEQAARAYDRVLAERYFQWPISKP